MDFLLFATAAAEQTAVVFVTNQSLEVRGLCADRIRTCPVFDGTKPYILIPCHKNSSKNYISSSHPHYTKWGVLNTSMMRFSCILFTIYFCRCKLYRSRSKALCVGLFRAIPSYTPLMQAEMPQIRAVHRRRVSLCLDRNSLIDIDALAGNYAAESKRLLKSDCSTLSLNRALCKTHC